MQTSASISRHWAQRLITTGSATAPGKMLTADEMATLREAASPPAAAASSAAATGSGSDDALGPADHRYLIEVSQALGLEWGQPVAKGQELSTLPEDRAPSARLAAPEAQGAPTRPGAPPQPLGGLPWARLSPAPKKRRTLRLRQVESSFGGAPRGHPGRGAQGAGRAAGQGRGRGRSAAPAPPATQLVERAASCRC